MAPGSGSVFLVIGVVLSIFYALTVSAMDTWNLAEAQSGRRSLCARPVSHDESPAILSSPLLPLFIPSQTTFPLCTQSSNHQSAFSFGLLFSRNPPPPLRRLSQDVVDYPQPFFPFRNSKSKEASQLKASFPKPPSASDFLLGETPPSCSCLPNFCTSCRGQSAKDFFCAQ